MSSLTEKFAAAFPLPIKKMLQVEDDCILLFDPDASSKAKYWKHLIRITPDAEVLWEIGAPNLPNNFLDIQLSIDGENIIAWTWDCYRLLIDKNTGTIISSAFTK
jgi:hypothetical protein